MAAFPTDKDVPSIITSRTDRRSRNIHHLHFPEEDLDIISSFLYHNPDEYTSGIGQVIEEMGNFERERIRNVTGRRVCAKVSRFACIVEQCTTRLPNDDAKILMHILDSHVGLLQAISPVRMRRIFEDIRGPDSDPVRSVMTRPVGENYERAYTAIPSELNAQHCATSDEHTKDNKCDAEVETNQDASGKGIVEIIELSGRSELRIDGEINGLTVEALADTGASINAISQETAAEMDLEILPGTKDSLVQLPSGETRRSLGIANVVFSFLDSTETHIIACTILPNLEHSLVLALDFLMKSWTLTKYKARLKKVRVPGPKVFALRLLDSHHAQVDGRARFPGFINHERSQVIPDTASTIMVMSLECTRKHQLPIDYSQRFIVEFADRSKGLTIGTAKAHWNFDFMDAPVMYEWHVLDGLNVDAILSLEFIQENRLFDRFINRFVPVSIPSVASELYGICEVARGSKKLGSLADDFFADMACPDPFTYEMIVKEDARRCEIQEAITKLPAQFQEVEKTAESKRIAAWEDKKSTHLQKLQQESEPAVSMSSSETPNAGVTPTPERPCQRLWRKFTPRPVIRRKRYRFRYMSKNYHYGE